MGKHGLVTHLLMHLGHLIALHVSHLRQEVDLLLHLGNLRILRVIANTMWTHLLHGELHSHWHHLRRHLGVLHWILWHHRILHKLLLVILAFDFLQLLSLSLIHAWIVITTKDASLHRPHPWIGLLEFHFVCLESAWSLLEASWVLLAHRLLAMVAQISSYLFIRERRAILLVRAGKLIR